MTAALRGEKKGWIDKFFAMHRRKEKEDVCVFGSFSSPNHQHRILTKKKERERDRKRPITGGRRRRHSRLPLPASPLSFYAADDNHKPDYIREREKDKDGWKYGSGYSSCDY